MPGAASRHDHDGAGPELAPAAEEGAKVIDLATRNALSIERPRYREDRLGMFAGLAVVALLIAMTVWTVRASQEQPGRSVAARPGDQAGWPGASLPPGMPDNHRLSIDMPESAGQTLDADSVLPAPDLSPVLANPSALPEIGEALSPEPIAKRTVGPTVVFENGTSESAVGFAFEQGSDNEFGGAVRPERNTPAKGRGAGKALPSGPTVDPVRILGRGTLIPAILETAIDSDIPGGVRAVVSTDVLSSDGKRSVVPRSSRLIGQYKTRRAGGQHSAYVVWTQIVRPDGVKLDIPSTAAGASERQFFERFGSARLVSVIAGPSGADLRARQGEPVRIVAARDVDLSNGR